MYVVLWMIPADTLTRLRHLIILLGYFTKSRRDFMHTYMNLA